MNVFYVTGCSGGIGEAIVSQLCELGLVVGIDIVPPCEETSSKLHKFMQMDFSQLSSDESYRLQIQEQIKNTQNQLDCCCTALVNVAAVQILNSIQDSTCSEWQKTFQVNCFAPVLMSGFLYSDLKKSKGIVINIGSIHSEQTKKDFGIYAASKAALSSVTRSMALDWAGSVRAVCIAPAAIETKMLLAGFESDKTAYDKLADSHPSRKIGSPLDVAKLVTYLVNDTDGFINGVTLNIDGGISGKLVDPLA